MGDTRPPGGRSTDQNLDKRSDDCIKYFITNLPDGCSGGDLERLIKDFGDVQKVYIARKRDKTGRRFCFITIKIYRNKDDVHDHMQNRRSRGIR
ncbi:putative RNA recognition motif domain, nucleotide-binding alpha-beta plait domain superfamily [Helianthus anomalus]